MPAKSHGRKRYTQQKPVEKAPAVETGIREPVEVSTNVVAAPLPGVKQVVKSAAPSTQPAPRRYYVGRELLRVAIVSVITLAILIVLAVVLR